MITIYVENRPYSVKDGQNLLQACLSLGFDLPYFCWHPALHSVGACRQCAVKVFRDENDRHGRIVMACMTPVTDGVRVSIDDPEAREFRARVTEFLMVNHPHDCPVCDEGGECHLQDMTVMTGHSRRRYPYAKRTHRNQELGPFIAHEMNRCIACYRCLRFYRDYAQGTDFGVFGWHHGVYFGRAADGALESEFSGNLVEVCPTGVFTDKTQQAHFTRKWDLQTAPSVCVHCSVGCNTIPGEREGLLRRIRNRYHPDVNGYFLCDRGRYGYEFVNAGSRVRRPQFGAGAAGGPRPASPAEALAQAAGLLRDPARVIGIGSPRASLEANFALRTLVGPDRFYAGVSAAERACVAAALAVRGQGPARTPSLREMESADAVLILGEDLTHTAPMLALAVRQALRQQARHDAAALGIPHWNDGALRDATPAARSPLFVAAPCATRLDDAAAEVYRAAPESLARLGLGLAHLIHAGAPAAEGLDTAAAPVAGLIAAALAAAERPLVVTGFGCGSAAVIRAAAQVAWALCAAGRDAALCVAVPECNSVGLHLLEAGDLAEAVRLAQAGAVETLVVLENDLHRRLPAGQLESLLGSVQNMIALDHTVTPTARAATVLFPAATYAESEGTLVNYEGRAQRHHRVFPAAGEVRESWRWLRDLMQACGRKEGESGSSADPLLAALAKSEPRWAELAALFADTGVPVPGLRIPRQPHRWSGRTALRAHLNVREGCPPADPDSPLAFSMEGFQGQPSGPWFAREWAPGWNSPQAITKFQEEVNGPLRGGTPGRLLLPARAATAPAWEREAPPAFVPAARRLRVVPLHRIFGSEELSRLAPAIAGRSPAPCLALHPEDARELDVREGDTVQAEDQRWPVRFDPSLPRGVAGLCPGPVLLASPVAAVRKAGAA